MKTRTYIFAFGRAAFAGVCCTSLLGLLLVGGVSLRAQTVNFPDSNLLTVVRETIPKLSGDITVADMLGLTNQLVANGRNIHDLTGLETALNLLDLQVEWNPITNHTAISALTNLLILSVSANGTPDVGFVAPLKKLQNLNLYSNGIEDISPLAGLVSLRTLVLSRNPVTNYTALAGLTNLVDLSLLGNGVTNLGFIAPLGQLQRLNLEENSVQDISVLAGWTNVLSLNLIWNGVTNPVVLATLTGLQELHLTFNSLTNVPYLAGLTNLTGLDLPYTDLADMSPLTNLTELVWLNVGENQLTGLPDLSGLTNLRVFMMAGNQITDLSPVTNLTAMLELHAQRNLFSSVAPLSGCPWLERLLLSGNSLTHLAEISALTNLHYLQLREMQITDLDFVVPLTALNDLDIGDNRVTDISALTNLPELHFLSSERNRLVQVEPLLDCPSFWYMNLRENFLDTNATSAAWNVITNLIERGVTVEYDPQNPPPVPLQILAQPANRSAFVSGNVVFSVSVTGGTPGPSYRWQKDGIDLADDSRISGTETDTLQINEVSADDSGFYRVRIWDEWMTTNSLAAELKIVTNVAFADPNLEQAVRAQLSIYARPLTPDDLVGMTSLYAAHTYWEITNLSGLEAAADLEELDLEGQIVLQGFAPLTFLSQFHTLRLSHCELESLDFVSTLSPLTGLQLSGNFIEDLSPLSQQPSLQFLWLEENQLTQINPLLDLPALNEVYLQCNRLDTNATSAAWNVITNLQSRPVPVVEYVPQNPAPDRPVITLQPVNIAAYLGDDIYFRVEATGSGLGLNYRWQKNGINLTDNARMWGTDSDTLHIDDLESGDAGSYRVRIWDENGVTNSRTVTLRVVSGVTFVDPQLELAVRDRLHPNPITLSTLATMDWLDAVNYGITNLSGIESAVNLNWLSLRSNHEITDFTPLTALWRLTYLELNDCEVNDIAFVADMPPLNELHLWRGNITDISPLLAQPQLLRLNLAYHTGITNIEALNNLTKMEWLRLEGTGIEDISFATLMPNLSDFSFEACAVHDLNPLSGATPLTWLDMANNLITNAVPLASGTNLEWLSAGNNQINDLSFTTNLHRLWFLSVDRNPFADLTPVAGLTNLQVLDISSSSATNLAVLANLKHLTDLQIANLGLSNNLGYLSTMTNLQVLGAGGNFLTNVPPYSSLQRLRYLNLESNPIANLNFAASLTNLRELIITGTGVSSLSPLAGRTNIQNLALAGNGISDISVLATLPFLDWITLWDNHVQDISALAGMTNLHYVDLRHNWLNITPGSAAMTVIATLQARGTYVDYDPQNEAPVAITLSVTRSNTAVIVSWPSPSADWMLQQNTNSISSLNWSNVTSGIQDDGTTKTVVVTPPTGNRFYRLSK